MIKILFICHGNICRSPMAEIFMKDDVLRAGLSKHFYIDSAAVSTEEIYNGVGNPVYPPAKAELRRHGLSCEGKKARQMTEEDYQKFDLLIGMDSSNISWMKRIAGGDPDGKIFKLMDFADNHLDIEGHGVTGIFENSDSKHVESRDVMDPWYTGDFKATWNDIVKGCTALREILTFKNQLVLASGSPRRKELCEQIGYELTIDPSYAEENVTLEEIKNSYISSNDSKSDSLFINNDSDCRKNSIHYSGYLFHNDCMNFVSEYVSKLSEIKVLDVAKRHPSDFILGADTVVFYDGNILGKPKSCTDAIKMLSMLSGKTHQVHTGVTILRTFDGKIVYRKTFSECTEVVFYDLSEKEIDEYVATGEPMDKAGSYGIQGRGAVLVKEIHGDYNNVVGLPTAAVDRILRIE